MTFYRFYANLRVTLPLNCSCVCVCVPLVVTGIPLNCFVLFQAGGPWTLGWHGPTKTHPSCRENVPAWCASLVPPPSPSLPLSFFAFWGFPEWNTQDLPFLFLLCSWTIVRSWEHLPFSFLSSPFLSFFLSSLHLPSSLGVPGCFCHSWEPFSSLPLVCPWTHAS